MDLHLQALSQMLHTNSYLAQNLWCSLDTQRSHCIYILDFMTDLTSQQFNGIKRLVVIGAQLQHNQVSDDMLETAIEYFSGKIDVK
jgi:hypothetical protein